MTLYIYNVETNDVIAEITGETNKACEEKMADLGYDASDEIASAYNDFGLNRYSDVEIETYEV